MKDKNHDLFLTTPSSIDINQEDKRKTSKNTPKPIIKVGFNEADKLERPTYYTKAI